MITQYIGTYTQSEIDAHKEMNSIEPLQKKEHYKKMKYINYRTNKAGNVEVWLSDTVSDYTTV